MSELNDLSDSVKDLNSGNVRKRKKNEDMWVKNRRKFAKNSDAAHGAPSIACNHKKGNSLDCMAYLLTPDDESTFLIKFSSTKQMLNKRILLQSTYFPERKNKIALVTKITPEPVLSISISYIQQMVTYLVCAMQRFYL